ncbi:hypothetical protein [Marinicella meishanensis]|uniref:hypothetical protein n=1 Tax=Marinicella meishanensis TaxID=2873263 RepID=UPI001CBA963C|nr:hypothetical protein [Marinicella sp. NBU2979]
MIEYILLVLLLLILLVITQFNRMMQWSLKKQNLQGLQAAQHGSELEQRFYQGYMQQVALGHEPRIKAVVAAIEFTPPIEAVDQTHLKFNLSPTAINHLQVAQERLLFTGKFGGTAIQVSVPLNQVELLTAAQEA